MMENEHVFLAANGNGLSRVKNVAGQWVVSHLLDGVRINCMVSDPANTQKIFLGTQANGILFSSDAGQSWQPIGLYQIPIKSIAVDPSDPKTIYAGGKPVSLYVSHDGGTAWEEIPAMRKAKRFWWISPADPPGIEPYVNGLAVSPANPNIILAGIEAGAVIRSEDRGRTWSSHLRGCDRDCHSLKFHPADGHWAYEAGGMSGVAFSQDGGKAWRKPKEGLGTKYGWAVAADPMKPEIWYLSAAEPANLLLGEFTPPGHQDGQANAHIYRKNGDAPWQQLSGGLPEPLDYMAYDLAVVPGLSGHIYAGLANGQIWHSDDYGNHWAEMPFNIGRVHKMMIIT
jgi:hypothetical protein